MEELEQALHDSNVLAARLQERVDNLVESEQRFRQLAENEQLLIGQLLGIQEHERQTVAHDIHDRLVQDIVGAHLHLQSIRASMHPLRIATKVAQASLLLEKAIEQGRRLIRDLRPLVLDDEGIVEAIRHLIADQRRRRELVVAFDHNVQFDRLEPKREGAIFRIVQEALSNVMRHAGTNHAAVELIQRDGTLDVVVRDQGVGFDPQSIPTQSVGLRAIREQARLFGGEAAIDSARGGGTKVFVRFPLSDASG
jgi:signal transduction histidine kinase